MNLWFDLKYAWRLLLKSPGHSLLCIGVVALSVGLSLVAYSVTNYIAFKPLGFPDSERWYVISDEAATGLALDNYTYQTLVKRSRNINHLGAISATRSVLSEGRASVNVSGTAITPALLKATHVAPILGRVFDAADSQTGTVMLSYATWQTYFAGDPNVIGKQTRINGTPMQIIGVLPQGFKAILAADLWFPLETKVTEPGDATAVIPIVDVNKTQSPDSVLNELNAVVSEVNLSYPDQFKADRKLAFYSAHQALNGKNIPLFRTMAVVVAFVALLGCVNISTLFFARMLERGRELAIRTALGCSRGRLIRQSLVESSLVALAGMAFGITLGILGLRGIRPLMERMYAAYSMTPPGDMSVGYGDMMFAAAAATAMWLFSSLAPAIRVSKQDAAAVLAGSGKGAGNRGSTKSTALLVGFQVIISCFLLVVSCTLVVTMTRAANTRVGVTTDKVVVSVGGTHFGEQYVKQGDRLRYQDEFAAAIKTKLAGAEVAFTTALPGWPGPVSAVALESAEPTPRDRLRLPLICVSDNYFRTLGISLRAGRLFDSTDNSASLNVAVLDEELAKRYWPGQDPLGKRIQLQPEANGPWLTVIGVVSNVKRILDTNNTSTVYRPLRQESPATVYTVVKLPRTVTETGALLAAVAFAVDRDLPLSNVQTLEWYLDGVAGPATFVGRIFALVALITVFLAAIGLFGMIVRSVLQRTPEIGVRRALGATQGQIITVFLRQGAMYLVVAIVIGGGLGIVAINSVSAVTGSLMSLALPVALGVFASLTIVVFTASYFPARRAVALEPGDALRYE